MGTLFKGVRAQQRNQRYYMIKNGRERDEYLKCSMDIVYFIHTYVKITHPVKGKVDFKLFGFQSALLWVYIKHRFNVTLKPRQMGISTLVCAYILWLAMFHPYKNILLISIKEVIARNMLRKVVFMYNNLPDFLKMEVINSSGDRVGTSSELMFSNGSQISALASTENAGRSDAVSCLVMDEVAFQRYASGIWTAAQPSLSTGGQAILLSSAFGMGNFFHETYMGALQGINGFHPVRLKWTMHPERTMKWYDEQLLTLGRKRVAQEVDCNFLQSGFNVFDMAKVRAIEDRLKEREPIDTDLGGAVKVYFAYDATKQYYLGGDVSSGKARDYSSFSIFDNEGVEAACFKGKLTPTQYGHLTMKWGQKFGMAMLGPEVNNHGNGVISTYQAYNYPNLYVPTSNILKVDDYNWEESDSYGWLTTGKSRNDMISGMDEDLDHESVELWNPFFVQEAYTFIYSANNKPIALGKQQGRSTYNSMYEDEEHGVVYTDDAIIGACIGNAIRKNPGTFKGALPFIGGSGR